VKNCFAAGVQGRNGTGATQTLSRIFTYLLTYLLTLWCRVLLENLTGLQLVKKFPAFHGTRRFITALTNVCHLSLCWASPIQSIYPHPTSLRAILILSTHLRLGLPSGLLPSGFPSKTLYTYQGSLRFKFHMIEWLTRQCNFIYAQKKKVQPFLL